MNIISADFDLIMVNRPNERLYGKPMVDLLGKKCYREFEKRDEPCPTARAGFPSSPASAHEAETERSPGRRHLVLGPQSRTHPVQGLDDVPTGFIEVVEDITEQKRAEKLGRIEADLRKALTPVQNVRKALTLAFEAALRVESIDGGCVFLLAGQVGRARSGREPRPVGGDPADAGEPRAADPECADLLEGIADGPPVGGRAYRSSTAAKLVAIMIAASSTYPAIPPTLLAGLHSLGATVAGAIGRIWAEQSRGDAVADLEAIITHAPMAAFILDAAGRVTMWNRAAERLFGWKASEVVKRPCPFPRLLAGELPGTQPFSDARGPLVEEAVFESKDGRLVDVRLT